MKSPASSSRPFGRARRVLAAAYLLAAAFTSSASLYAAPEIIVDPHGVLVAGLDPKSGVDQELPREKGRQILRVVALDMERSASRRAASNADDAIADLPPLLGSFRIEDGDLRFAPCFPPAPGLVLDMRFDGDAWDRLVGREESAEPTPDAARRWLVPEPEQPGTARVLAVTPSGRVPENLLRLYVYFSEPMSARHVLDHVALLGDDGESVPVAFVDVPGGLWGPERRRLTLFVHPGRVKRGVGPNEVLGPVLEEGKSYTLRIDAEARDAHGRAIAESYGARLDVGAADRTSPDPSKWRLVPPPDAESPLLVHLDEPADTALLARLPSLEDAESRRIRTTATVEDEGRRLRLEPASPWSAGSYRLLVPAALEDPSGNRVDRLFEEAPDDQEAGEAAPVEVLFDITFEP